MDVDCLGSGAYIPVAHILGTYSLDFFFFFFFFFFDCAG